ncbi:MAG: hypothetical protein AAGH64_03260, partial [Planctomycetota bacterium]
YVLETKPGLGPKLIALAGVERVETADLRSGFVRHTVHASRGRDPRADLYALARDEGAVLRELRREVEPLERFYLRLVERVAQEGAA